MTLFVRFQVLKYAFPKGQFHVFLKWNLIVKEKSSSLFISWKYLQAVLWKTKDLVFLSNKVITTYM